MMRRDYEAISRALSIGARAHETQRRKGSAVPYIVHPAEVGMLLIEEDQPQPVVVAGILHDVLEDTTIRPEELEKWFGPEVRDLVLEVTEVMNGIPRDSWEIRKSQAIGRVPDLSPGALMITCADKLSNIRSIHNDHKTLQEAVWDRFNRPKNKQRWYYHAIYQALEPLEGTMLYRELGRYIALVFGPEEQND